MLGRKGKKNRKEIGYFQSHVHGHGIPFNCWLVEPFGQTVNIVSSLSQTCHSLIYCSCLVLSQSLSLTPNY